MNFFKYSDRAQKMSSNNYISKTIFVPVKLIYRILFFSFLVCYGSSNIHAQGRKFVRDSIMGVSMIKGGLSYNFSFLDLDKRFGNVSSVGGEFGRKTKSNFYWGFDAYFLFGGTVKENNMLDGLYTGNNFIIGLDGTLYDVRFLMRGFMFNAKIGKLFPVFGPNKNSGILFTTGVGLLQHKIRFEFEKEALPQLTNEYKKGYDRQSNGLNFQQFIGYSHLSNKNLMNYYIGLELNYALTEGRRSYQFDLMRPDHTPRKDMMIGMRVGIIIPLYQKLPPDFYYF